MERLKKRAEHSGRADDNEETIKNRLIVFDKEITPIIDHFQSKGILSQVNTLFLGQSFQVCFLKESHPFSFSGDVT